MFKKNDRYMIYTPNGFSDFDGINVITKDKYKTIITEEGHYLKCSYNHKVSIGKGFISAKNLIIGDYIETSTGLSKISEIKEIENEIVLYDPVNVRNQNTYYSNNIISHNCQFLGSTSTVISPETLEYLFTQTKEPLQVDMQGKFRVYEKPLTGAKYVLGVDTAKGTGEDYSVVQVLKFTGMSPLSFEQVAVFSDNFTDVYNFADIVNRICIYYNGAFIMCENNAEGSAVVNKLWWDIECEHLVNSGSKSVDLGIRATRTTKPKAVLLMKKLIEDQCLIIPDKETVEQLSSFIEEKGRFFGKDLHDDAVSALYWTCYISQMDLFEEEISLKKIEKGTEKEEEEIWGVLADINEDASAEDWSWVTSINLTD